MKGFAAAVILVCIATPARAQFPIGGGDVVALAVGVVAGELGFESDVVQLEEDEVIGLELTTAELLLKDPTTVRAKKQRPKSKRRGRKRPRR